MDKLVAGWDKVLPVGLGKLLIEWCILLVVDLDMLVDAVENLGVVKDNL